MLLFSTQSVEHMMKLKNYAFKLGTLLGLWVLAGLPGTVKGEAPGLITEPPVSTTVNEGEEAVFVVTFQENHPSFTVILIKNGAFADIAFNVESESLQFSFPALIEDNGASIVFNVSSELSEITEPVFLTVIPDESLPEILEITGQEDLRSVVLVFSEALDQESAENIANYSIENLEIESAVQDEADASIVTLSTSIQIPGNDYSLSINGVKDASAAGNEINETIIVFQSADASSSGQELMILEPPQALTIEESRLAEFKVTFQGDPPIVVTWLKNDEIAFSGFSEEGESVFQFPASLADDGSSIVVEISNPTGKVRSDPVNLTVIEDLTAPELLSVESSSDFESVTLVFNEALAASSAENRNNYSIDGLDVLGAGLAPGDPAVVRLITSKQEENTEYVLVIANLKDLSLAANIFEGEVTFISLKFVSGSLLRSVYPNVEGDLLDSFYPQPRGRGNLPLPSGDDGFGLSVDLFETPINAGDNYGVILSGFIVPEVSGRYEFYVSGDGPSELYLSFNENPANSILIAYEPSGSNSREWLESETRNSDFPENRSTPIPLETGARYYVEAIMKEVDGQDHLAVTWKAPGDDPPENESAPIAGELLGRFVPGDLQDGIGPGGDCGLLNISSGDDGSLTLAWETNCLLQWADFVEGPYVDAEVETLTENGMHLAIIPPEENQKYFRLAGTPQPVDCGSVLITFLETQVRISWESTCNLQWADEVEGPWNNSEEEVQFDGDTRFIQIDPLNLREFYRLVNGL
jgi:hypothetical protein